MGMRVREMGLAVIAGLLVSACHTSPAFGQTVVVTTETLLEEMADLDRLTRLPGHAYDTVQYSSYDRRSKGPEQPDWYANRDGFGRETVPGFEAVLREPTEGRPGQYLLAEVEGPGAVVRTWSAGMEGVLVVSLDGKETYRGPAYAFLARRSEHFFKAGGLALDAGDAFVQQDADYLPMPFRRSLRVTWEGAIDELHFYHLQVRRYRTEVPVVAFDAAKLAGIADTLRSVAGRLVSPPVPAPTHSSNHHLQPGETVTYSPGHAGESAAGTRPVGSACIRALTLKVDAERPDEALRGCLVRIAFDGSQRAQVEAPLGDFFGTGPGVNPFESVPMVVRADGSMTCLFPMPFQRSVELELVNTCTIPVTVAISTTLAPYEWDDRSLYFRARWRVDHDLVSGFGENRFDLPFVVLRGAGRLVGVASMIANPSGAPRANGNWWGEGDEKIFVDDRPFPVAFGTGSEDYYNYSWSRWDLFDHPYCGQPLDSGPDTAGYISNHRFQILDDIPFETFLAFYMELWQHGPSDGLGYGRIAYLYARPGALDDHRRLVAKELVVPALAARLPVAFRGARGSTFHYAEFMEPRGSGSLRWSVRPEPLAPRGKVLHWQAVAGEQLDLTLEVESAGKFGINAVAVHSPAGARIRLRLDGEVLAHLENDEGEFSLTTDLHTRLLNLRLAPVELSAGSHTISIECTQAGDVGLEYFWVQAVQ